MKSDIAFPNLLDEFEFGEKFYDFALPGEKIKQAKFNYDGRVKNLVGILKQRSNSRVKKSKGFDKIREEIAEFKKNKENRTRISLKEDKKKKDDKEEEKEEAEANLDDINLKDDFELQEALFISADLIKKTKQLPFDSEYILADINLKKPIANQNKTIQKHFKKAK